MSNRNTKRYWLIKGWDGIEEIYEERILVGQITENRLKELLRTLTAKLALTEREIIASYAKRRTRVHHDYLEVSLLNGNKYMYSCGDNPYVTAEVIDGVTS